MGEKPVVMVVDDENDILRVVETALRQAGFVVNTARSADAAVRSVQTMGTRPALLLTDVVMPGMSGPVLADQLRAAIPDLRVLFMSGYDDRQIVQKYVIDHGFALLPKPFNPQTLIAAVRDALASDPQPIAA